jgi:hypothetical protein
MMRSPRWQVGAVGLGGTVVVGAATVWSPWATVGAMGVVCAVTVGMFFARRLPGFFLGLLGLILIGYAFFGRSFAYLGKPPVFVGELVLAIGLLAVLVSGGLYRAFRSPLTWILLAFAAWGAIRTVPFINTYHTDALRDGAMWGYGLFAILVAAFLPRTRWPSRIPAWYRRALPWFVIWVPVGWLINHYLGDSMPTIPGSNGVLLLTFKSGDAAVHLAGIAAFLVIGLQQSGKRSARGGGTRASEWIVWALWLVGFMLVAATNRGGALASIAALFTVSLLRPAAARRKIPVVAVLAGALMLVGSVANTASLSLANRDRDMSPQQIVTNLKSIFEGGGGVSLEGSRRWRLAWWTRIKEYTLHGDFFWTGKGFGVNLADDDGFQVSPDHSLRSPHNAHLMLLARTGVPGEVLWLLLQGAFGIAMVASYRRARRESQERLAQLSLWVLAYWIAFLVNASFDVFLEGPQGDIWFWSLFGVGIVITRMSQEEAARVALAVALRERV